MLESGGDASLIEEHVAELNAVGEVREDQLERDDLDEAPDSATLGDVEATHASFSQQPEEAIATEGFVHLDRGVSQRAHLCRCPVTRTLSRHYRPVGLGEECRRD